MGKSFMIRVPVALFLAGVITFGCPGCQAIKMALQGPSPEGVVHES